VTVASVGTTAEVLAVKEDTDNLSGLAVTRIKAIGRQRFKVLSTTRQLGGFDSFLCRCLYLDYYCFVSCLVPEFCRLGCILMTEPFSIAAAVFTGWMPFLSIHTCFVYCWLHNTVGCWLCGRKWSSG